MDLLVIRDSIGVGVGGVIFDPVTVTIVIPARQNAEIIRDAPPSDQNGAKDAKAPMK
jgi:hypothetical protein